MKEFIVWFSPKMPNSYKTWLGKNIEAKFNDIKINYRKSFNQDLFDIEINTILNSVEKIKTNIDNRFEVNDKSFSEYNKKSSNGIPQAIISKWYIPFLLKYNNLEIDNNAEENTAVENEIQNKTFAYEKDLQNALISQTEDLFQEYTIYGNNGEGIEYNIEGKKIDLLLEHVNENKLLAIELKAEKADFKVFGQISMYLQLLEERFPDKEISGIIIAGEIDDTLKIASKRDKKVKLLSYKMKLELNEI